jgi:uncharacterized protein (DUF342 family)
MPSENVKPLKNSGKEEEREVVEVVMRGFARKGSLVATVRPAVPGKFGKDVLGNDIPPEPIKEARLLAGRNIRVEKGTQYFMGINGKVEVLRDKKGTYSIQGTPYRNGSCSIQISEDEMSAYITIIPPLGGGRNLEMSDAILALQKKGVVFGIREDALKRAIEKCNRDGVVVEKVAVAEGERPVHGRDGRIEFKVVRATGSRVSYLEDGRVDYKEQDLITNVKENQLVVVVKKAQEGLKNGQTVTGRLIKAQKGKDVFLNAGNNIRVEEHEGEVHFYSMIDGQLITRGNEISVEPVLVIEGDIGPETGNIQFNGIVQVKGNVSDTYNVYAGKDIIIGGNVGNSVVKSEGNIIVKNGVIGKHRGLVWAKGNVDVKFAENANILAGGDITIKRAALNCRLTAGNRIIATQEKGQIIGGEIRAKRGLEVKILGNELEHSMDVYVGTDFSLLEGLKEIRKKISTYEAALRKINLVIDKIEKINPNQATLPENIRSIYENVRKKATAARIAISELKKREAETMVELEKILKSDVIVHETLFRGVKIYFGKFLYEPEDTKTRVRVFYDENYRKISVEKYF